MFGFFEDMFNYQQRKVERTEYRQGWVDTCAISDSKDPYETAVKDSRYNNGTMVIVETYGSKEKAITGHSKWVKKMSAKTPPKELVDRSTAEVAEIADAIGGDKWRRFPLQVGEKKANA